MESKEKLMPAEIAFGQIMTTVDIANHAFYEGTIKPLVAKYGWENQYGTLTLTPGTFKGFTIEQMEEVIKYVNESELRTNEATPRLLGYLHGRIDERNETISKLK